MTFHDPQRYFFIWCAECFVDGEAFPDTPKGRESLYASIAALGRDRINYRMPDFTVHEIHMGESTMRDVTEDMVREAYEAGNVEPDDLLYDLYCQGMSAGSNAEHRLTGTDYGLTRMARVG